MHDFRIFKGSLQEMNTNILCLADSEYLGIKRFHANSQIPSKKSKHHPLTKEQKAANHQLAKRRIFCEH